MSNAQLIVPDQSLSQLSQYSRKSLTEVVAGYDYEDIMSHYPLDFRSEEADDFIASHFEQKENRVYKEGVYPEFYDLNAVWNSIEMFDRYNIHQNSQPAGNDKKNIGNIVRQTFKRSFIHGYYLANYQDTAGDKEDYQNDLKIFTNNMMEITESLEWPDYPLPTRTRSRAKEVYDQNKDRAESSVQKLNYIAHAAVQRGIKFAYDYK